MIKDHDISLSKMIPPFCSQMTTCPQILFGGFPVDTQLAVLRDYSVRYIIDLTTPSEKKRLQPYHPKQYDLVYVNFPIKDNSIPHDVETFNEFIVWLSHLLNSIDRDCVYIHCKGGHGRSGLIVASILCFHYNKSPSESISETTHAHRVRQDITDKWRSRFCPSNPVQRQFIHQVFQSKGHHHDIVSEYRLLTYELKTVLNSHRKRLLEEIPLRIKLIEKD
jgi:hypothetical protein